MWIFVGMCALIILLKLCVMVLVPDVPIEVEIQLKRQEFIKSKLFDDEADDLDWELDKAEIQGLGDKLMSAKPAKSDGIDDEDGQPF